MFRSYDGYKNAIDGRALPAAIIDLEATNDQKTI